ncbi:MAG: SIP domain-containing protein [Paraglaciecola sp.]|uniref:SIP domain-containing protein n=1 Tax=Paraglaciecola sp. TaxID=1920173 RepID=UPI003298775C
MPDNAKGEVWIQVPEELDKQNLVAPANMLINWLVTPDKLTGDFLLALSSQTTNLNNTAIFIAAEACVVKQLKAHLNEHCHYDKPKLYASAYWNRKK